MTSLSAIIFDMDGLILDSEPVYQEAWSKTALRMGFEIEHSLHVSLVGRNQVDSYRMLADALGPQFRVDEFHQTWPEVWRERVQADGLALKPGLGDMLALTEKFGIARAIATSSDRDNTELSLRATALWNRFEVIVTGDQVQCGKPQPDIYLEAAKRIGVPPTDCLVLEDSDPGVMAAVNAGMRVIQIPDLTVPGETARRLTLASVGSLHEALPIVAALLD